MNILKSIMRNNLRSSKNIQLTPHQEKIKATLQLSSDVDTSKPLTSIRFVTIDLEATGFKATVSDKVLSLGAVVVENGRVNENKTFYELVNPERTIPKNITKLTGITENMIIDKPSLIEILPHFFSWIGDGVLVGHIINFDISFLNHCLNHQCGSRIKYKYIDTRDLITTLYPRFTNCSLEEICFSLGIPAHNRHNALGDAIMAAKIFEFSIKELAKRGVYTLEDLFNYTRDRQCFASPITQILI
ncbi:MAG: PolC-type DNA polymerase III [Vulcanibacillus sp.]